MSINTAIRPIPHGSGALRHLLAVLAIVALNVITFSGHYAGHYAFPWDFLGGYHAQAFGWFDLGSVIDPPGWLPWTDMGFPSVMALQSGAWYLPLALLDALGIPYTMRVAVAIQCAHVALAALGVYALVRRLQIHWGIALVGAIAFHFGATFYSNQQHVDIVRAVALLPWLLYFLHPRTLATRWGPGIGGLVLSQLLISGYPGNVVASAYACALWCILGVLALPKQERPGYIWRAGLLLLVGVLIAMAKWLPVAMDLSAVEFERWTAMPIEPPYLLTLLFPYERGFLPGDVTMRSLWLPTTALWGWVYSRPGTLASRLAIGLVLLALVMAMLLPVSNQLLQMMPGMSSSRWLISDWRPVLQLGLLIGACQGWHYCMQGGWSRTNVVRRNVVALAMLGAAIAIARHMGYGVRDLYAVVLVVGVLCVVGALRALDAGTAFRGKRLANLLFVGALCLMCAFQGVFYNFTQASAWRMPWNPERERAVYGDTVQGWMDHQREEDARRPRRMLLGSSKDPVAAVAKRTDEKYNQCWYAHSYCVFGYNNIRLSRPHRDFVGALQAEGGDRLLAFASRPQQLWINTGGPEGLPEIRPEEDEVAVIGPGARDIGVEFLNYGANDVRYNVRVPRQTTFTENEIWWSGWQYRTCNEEGCGPWADTIEGAHSLRAWTVPEGTWNVQLRYKERSLASAMQVAGFGLLLMLGTIILPMRRHRSPVIKASAHSL